MTRTLDRLPPQVRRLVWEIAALHRAQVDPRPVDLRAGEPDNDNDNDHKGNDDDDATT